MSIANTHYGAERISLMLAGLKSIYFIGIGGINMSSLAHITHNRGYRVGGSDRTRTELTERLENEGVVVNYSHSAEHVKEYDAFVYTVAISEDNPEYRYAVDNGRPCISRADYLGYIMMAYPVRIGISGMHGKSTCTSMCAETLICAGAEPTVLSGAQLPIMGGAYCVGTGDSFVFEACEYMDSFLDFNPTVAVVLNIEMDHVDYFKSMEQIRASFGRFADIAGGRGYAVYNADDENVILALEGYKGGRLSFGIESETATLRAVNITSRYGKYSFDVVRGGEMLCHIDLRVSGYHNIYNALAATGACMLAGLSFDDISAGLHEFCGAGRRMEFKGCINGGQVYDDYGHHPTEISATLKGARAMTEGRLICVYQPHTYSRTAALIDEFAGAFEFCDKVIFTDIYAAREKNEWGVSSEGLAHMIGARAAYVHSFKEAADMVASELKAGDVAVVMGAGDIYKTFDNMVFDSIDM